MKNLYAIIAFLWSSPFIAAQPDNGSPIKLRVGTYNVGYFNQGKLGGYQGEDVSEELQRWHKWISEQSMDIFSLVEWNSAFDKDGKIPVIADLIFTW